MQQKKNKTPKLKEYSFTKKGIHNQINKDKNKEKTGEK